MSSAETLEDSWIVSFPVKGGAMQVQVSYYATTAPPFLIKLGFGWEALSHISSVSTMRTVPIHLEDLLMITPTLYSASK